MNFQLVIFKYLNIALIAFGFFYAMSAHAGAIFHAPNYLGLTSGLVGYWSFDGPDVAGVLAYDRSSSYATGTLTNGPRRVVGRIGQALEFTKATTSGVSMGDATTLNSLTSLTYSAWIYPRSYGNIVPDETGAILTKGDNTNRVNRAFKLDDATVVGSLEFFINCSGNPLDAFSVANSVTLNSWHHVSVTWTGGTTRASVTFYVDGVPVARDGTAGTDCSLGIGDDSPGRTSHIGGNTTISPTSGAFNGLIDDVRIYNRALSPDEIKRLYRIGGTLKLGKPAGVGLTDGLVGHWTFDEDDMAGALAYDRSTSFATGTLTNGPVRVAGRIGQALNFDGGDDYVDIGTPASLSLSGPMSVCAWINGKNLGGSNAIFSNEFGGGSQYTFETFTSGANLHFYWIGAGGLEEFFTGDILTDNRWYHTCAVRISDSNVKIYLDAVEQSVTNSGASGIPASAADTAIGREGLLNAGYFRGSIDDVRIYNRALSADEIKRLYRIGGTLKLGKPSNIGLTSGLVGHWTFDEDDMAGVLAYDKSTSFATGTLTNGPVRKIGRIGQALNFDGVDDRVPVVTDSIDTGTITLCGWINPRVTSSATEKALMSNARFFFGASNVNSRLNLYSNSALDPPLQSAVDSIVANAWQHICAVRNSGTNGPASIYINGVLNASGNSGTPVSGLGALNIGDDGFGDYFFNGLIDDVRVYNRALSPDEVRRLYNMGR